MTAEVVEFYEPAAELKGVAFSFASEGVAAVAGDPVLLVGVHIAGATTVVIAMVAFNLGLYTREPVRKVQTVSGELESAPLLARI